MSEIRKITASIINTLYNHGNLNRSVLAKLRGASSISSPQAQIVWPLIIPQLDDKDLKSSGEPSSAEVAVYTALRLYALHQPTNGDVDSVYASCRAKSNPGLSLFRALAIMTPNSANKKSLNTRVSALLKTSNTASLINSLTHLVKILRSNDRDFRIDYAELADQLYWFQQSYDESNRVRFQWGQDYNRTAEEPVTNEGMEK